MTQEKSSIESPEKHFGLTCEQTRVIRALGEGVSEHAETVDFLGMSFTNWRDKEGIKGMTRPIAGEDSYLDIALKHIRNCESCDVWIKKKGSVEKFIKQKKREIEIHRGANEVSDHKLRNFSPR